MVVGAGDTLYGCGRPAETRVPYVRYHGTCERATTYEMAQIVQARAGSARSFLSYAKRGSEAHNGERMASPDSPKAAPIPPTGLSIPFNTARLHLSIGYLAPLKYEQRHRELTAIAPTGEVA
jgi:hypothetical protein